MKKFFVFALGASMVAGAMSCGNGSATSASSLKSVDDSLNYYFGSLYGTMIKEQIVKGPDSAKFNQSEFLKALKQVLNADTASSSVQGMNVGMSLYMNAVQLREQQNVELDLNQLYKFLVKALEADSNVVDVNVANMEIGRLIDVKKANAPEAKANTEAGEKFIAEKMAADPEVKRTESGLAYKVIKEGEGEKFIVSDRINVVYTGTHIDGTEFDSSNGEARTFSPAGVVAGFKEGLLMMSPGAEYELYIPGNLAYGVNGNPNGGIGPNELLIFKVSTPSLYTPEEKKK